MVAIASGREQSSAEGRIKVASLLLQQPAAVRQAPDRPAAARPIRARGRACIAYRLLSHYEDGQASLGLRVSERGCANRSSSALVGALWGIS